MRNTSIPSFQRRALIIIIGILLYGGLSWVTNIFLAGGQGIEIRPGVADSDYFRELQEKIKKMRENGSPWHSMQVGLKRSLISANPRCTMPV